MTDWRVDAACVEVDGEIFFEDRDGGWREIESARRICNGCPVRERCLQYALEHNIKHGMWGALSPGARSRLKVRVA